MDGFTQRREIGQGRFIPFADHGRTEASKREILPPYSEKGSGRQLQTSHGETGRE